MSRSQLLQVVFEERRSSRVVLVLVLCQVYNVYMLYPDVGLRFDLLRMTLRSASSSCFAYCLVLVPPELALLVTCFPRSFFSMSLKIFITPQFCRE